MSRSGSDRSSAGSDQDGRQEGPSYTFTRSVEEGRRRVQRSTRSLLATGAVGGLDLGIGVIALLAVKHETGSIVLASLAFSIGFIALTLAHSELFTENFLVPIAALVAGKTSVGGVLRLWSGTLAMNLVGGWLVMALAILALPRLRTEALELGTFYPDLGIGAESLSLAILGGVAITLMTWMERGTTETGARLAAVIATAFILAVAPLNHSVVGSLEMFAALLVGAPFGYADWAGAAAWAVVGNALGGIGLVTVLRIAQLPKHRLEEEQARSIAEIDATIEDQE